MSSWMKKRGARKFAGVRGSVGGILFVVSLIPLRTKLLIVLLIKFHSRIGNLEQR